MHLWLAHTRREEGGEEEGEWCKGRKGMKGKGREEKKGERGRERGKGG